MRIYTVNVTATFANQVQVAANSESHAIQIATESAVEHGVLNGEGEYNATVVGSRVGLHPFLLDQSSVAGWRAMNSFEQSVLVKNWLYEIGIDTSEQCEKPIIAKINASIEGVL